jgi:predicted DNA-binding protein
MKGITIKLPEEILQRLRQEARATGRSIAELVRERVEARPNGRRETIYTVTSALAGVLDGSRKAATNARRRFRRR